MKKNKPPKTDGAAEDLMQSLFERMERQGSVEALNDNVIIPFAAALEEICRARGYVLNIHGEESNIVFTGDEGDAEAIYRLVEDYLEKTEKKS